MEAGKRKGGREESLWREDEYKNKNKYDKNFFLF